MGGTLDEVSFRKVSECKLFQMFGRGMGGMRLDIRRCFNLCHGLAFTATACLSDIVKEVKRSAEAVSNF
jgi:hypothetical protein